MIQLNNERMERYLHHITLKDIGGDGQRRLLASRVLIVGIGGLGSPAALYLTAAGIGTIGIIDDDNVDISNLQRQIIHHTNDIGRKKVESAEEKMRLLNTDVRIIKYSERLTEANVKSVIADYDFILDGSDNFQTKFLINDACVACAKPFSHAGVIGFKGQTFTFVPGSLCLRCIFPEPPEPGTILNCRGSGILGAVAGIVGSVQASETIKFILKKGTLLTDRLLTVDVLSMKFRTITIAKNALCPVCGTSDSDTVMMPKPTAR